MTVNDFTNLFRTDFKQDYRKRTDDLFEKKGTVLGIYKKSKKYNLYGILDEIGRWCWRNTLNTHPKCAYYIYSLYKTMKNNELDFYQNRENSLDELFKFLEENFELFFTKNITNKYYNVFQLLTNKSWSIGQITMIVFFFYYKEIFPDAVSMSFNLERGDPDDFKGIDTRVKLKNGTELKIQIKSGRIVEKKHSYIFVEGSVNNMKKNQADHYCYIDEINGIWNISVFKKDDKRILPNKNQLLFEDELLIKELKMENKISTLLKEIHIFCVENKITYDLNNYSEKNECQYDKNSDLFRINISDFNDENLYNILFDSYKNLKNQI